MKKIIATIELDNNLGRGKIYAERKPDEEGEKYRVFVELPGGEIEDPALPRRTTLERTCADIEDVWGHGSWYLQWEI